MRPWDLSRWQNFDQEVKDTKVISRMAMHTYLFPFTGAEVWKLGDLVIETWIRSSSRGDDRECILGSSEA